MSGVTAAGVAAAVTAGAAVAGTAYTMHQGNLAKKEQNRQKAIADDQRAKQDAEIANQKKMAADEEAALQKEIQDKQRADQAANDAVVSADQVQKRRMRGQRSLMYSEDDEELLG